MILFESRQADSFGEALVELRVQMGAGRKGVFG